RYYADLVEKLTMLSLREVDSRAVPDRLELTAEAKAAWLTWYDEWAQVQAAAPAALAAAYSKIEGAAARLALVHHVVSEVAEGRDATAPVSLPAMQCGIRMARWFGRETRRIYAALKESDAQQQLRQLYARVKAMGGSVTARDFHK